MLLQRLCVVAIVTLAYSPLAHEDVCIAVTDATMCLFASFMTYANDSKLFKAAAVAVQRGRGAAAPPPLAQLKNPPFPSEMPKDGCAHLR